MNVERKKTYRNVASTKLDHEIKKLLRPNGVETVTRKQGTLYEKLRTDKDARGKIETPGIYKVPIIRGNEKSAYIGRTQKSIAVRIQQHKNNIRNKTGATSLATAAIYENWVPKWEEVIVLSRSRTLIRSMLDEYIAIRNERKELINSIEISERLETWRKAIGYFN